MPTSKKRAVAKRTRNDKKTSTQHPLQPAPEDDLSESSDPPVHAPSDSESIYINQDGELDTDKVHQRVKVAQQIVADNRKRAEDFQNLVHQKRLWVRGRLKEHKQKMEDAQAAFEMAFRPALASALEPMSSDVGVRMNQREGGSKVIRTSILEADPDTFPLSKHSRQLCKAMTDVLECYSQLVRRDERESRLDQFRREIEDDKASIHGLVAAGTKKAKQDIYAKMVSISAKEPLGVDISAEERRRATLFEGYGDTVTDAEEFDGRFAGWDDFTYKLINTVRKMEDIVDHGYVDSESQN